MTTKEIDLCIITDGDFFGKVDCFLMDDIKAVCYSQDLTCFYIPFHIFKIQCMANKMDEFQKFIFNKQILFN